MSPGRDAEPTAITAIVLATVSADDGRPAAALPWGEGTVMARLLEQLAGLGVRRAEVVTRPGWEGDLEPSLAGLDLPVRLHASPAVADDLRIVAEAAGAGGGSVVILHGEIVTHREALASLMTDPRVVTGMLTRHGGFPPFLAPRTRSSRGRVLSASSPYHAAGRPNTTLLGILKVGPRDRAELAATADRLAALAEPPLPPEWEEELARKARRWRAAVADGGVGAHDGYRPGGADAPPAGESAPERDDAADGAEPDAEAVVLSPEDEAEVERRLAVLREDVVALLLVGLVRANVHIAQSYLRALFWSRPLSAAGVQQAAEQIEAYDEDRVLLNSAVKGNDGFFTTFFVSPYSKYIARWAAHRGLTPNQVTTISMAIGVLAATAFALGTRPGLVAGAVLLQLAFTADCVDGQLARYTRTFSKLGAWLDSVFDRGKEYVVFAGLAIGAGRGFGEDVWVLAMAAMTLQTVRHMLDFSYGTTQHQAIDEEGRPPLEQPGDRVAPRGSLPAVLPTSPPEDHGAAGGEGTVVPTVPSPSPLREAEPPAEAPDARAPARRPPLARRIPTTLARRAFGLSRALERWKWARWLKKILVFPIGERFAVISLAAALTTPKVTFIVVLAWGGFAAVYSLAGRLLRSFSR